MEIVRESCAGLDVHKKSVVVAVRTSKVREVRTYATTTKALLQMVDHLHLRGVRHIAMESTGVYWKPVFNLLEQADFEEVMVVNAGHMKQVPGRKTDVKDAEWIAELLQYGLLRASFVPNREHRELRDLLRYRRTQIQQRAHEVQRLEKTLQAANVKLSSVAADILGVSARAMLEALIEGELRPASVAELARGQLRKKKDALEQALEGTVGPHQRFMLRQHLELIDAYERQLQQLDEEVEKRMLPFVVQLTRIDEIRGIGPRTAQELVGEIGVDMSHWPSEKHFSSWAKLSPGNNESGGRKRSGRTGKGGPVRAIVIQAALNASKSPDTYYGAMYRRLCRRGSKERALVAVAHALLIAIYHMLRDGTVHQDLGPNHFDERRRQQSVRSALRHLQRLGYDLSIDELEQRRRVA